MRRESLIIMIILLLGSIAGVSHTVAETSSTPVLQDIWFGQSTATDGDTVNVYANVTDAEDDTNFVDFELYSVSVDGYTEKYLGYYSMTYNSSLNLWQGQFTVSQYWPSSDVNITYVYISDDAGNDQSYSIWDNNLQSPQITLNTSNPDNTAPVLHDIWFQSTTAEAGTQVTVFANVTDDKSGVRYVDAELYKVNSSSSYYWDAKYITYLSLYYNSSSNLYQATWDVSQYLENGTYHIPYVSVSDQLDNTRGYENYTEASYLLEAPRIDIYNYGQTDGNPPILHDISFKNQTVKTIDDQMVYLNISDDASGFSSGYVDYYYYNQSNGYEEYVGYSSVSSYNYNTTIGMYQSSIYIDNYIPVDTPIYAGYISLEDTAANWAYLNNGTDYISPTFTVENNSTGTSPTDPEYVDVQIHNSYSSSYVGEEVYFNTTITNEGSNSTSGTYSFEIFGAENKVIYTQSIFLYGYETKVIEVPVTFNITGEYTVLASFSDQFGYYNDSIGWYVDDTNGNTGSIDMSITPETGVNDVGQPVLFTTDITNTLTSTVTGNVTYETYGPENLTVSKGYFEISPEQTIQVSEEFTFNEAGYYSIIVTFYTDLNETFWVEANWEVNEPTNPPEGEDIFVYVTPNGDQSTVNETVAYEANITSTFTHDMPNVTLEVEVKSDTSNFTFYQLINLGLPANSSILEQFAIQFTQIGTFSVNVTLYDDINKAWNYEFTWKVISADDNPSDTTSITTTPTNSTENTNSTTLPEVSLPGFEFYISIISLTTIMILGYKRRRLYR